MPCQHIIQREWTSKRIQHNQHVSGQTKWSHQNWSKALGQEVRSMGLCPAEIVEGNKWQNSTRDGQTLSFWSMQVFISVCQLWWHVRKYLQVHHGLECFQFQQYISWFLQHLLRYPTSLPRSRSGVSALECFRCAIRVMACFRSPDEVSAGYDSGKLLSKALYSKAALQSKAATTDGGSGIDPQGLHGNYY